MLDKLGRLAICRSWRLARRWSNLVPGAFSGLVALSLRRSDRFPPRASQPGRRHPAVRWVEDGHFRSKDWAGVSQAQAINVAGAFLAAIPFALVGLEEPQLSDELRVDFQRAALQMTAGQHADLSGWPGCDEGAVKRYWQIATVKSGIPFALACRAGARLGNPPAEVLDAYADFGRAVGQLAQVCDDYKDTYEPPDLSDFQIGRASLPIVYGRTVASPAERARIEDFVIRATTDARSISQLQQLLEDLGARYYLLLQIELLGEQAEDALRRASVTGPGLVRLQELTPRVAERNRRE